RRPHRNGEEDQKGGVEEEEAQQEPAIAAEEREAGGTEEPHGREVEEAPQVRAELLHALPNQHRIQVPQPLVEEGNAASFETSNTPSVQVHRARGMGVEP